MVKKIQLEIFAIADVMLIFFLVNIFNNLPDKDYANMFVMLEVCPGKKQDDGKNVIGNLRMRK